MSGRNENKQRSVERMQSILADKPEYIAGYYNLLLGTREYLTAQDYTLTVIRYLDTINYNLEEFTVDSVVLFLLQLKGRNGECSDSFKATTKCALNAFGKYLSMRKIVPENPLNDFPSMEIKDVPKKVSMTPSELKKILSSIENNEMGSSVAKGRRKEWIERNYAIFRVLITTGMRVTALVEADLSDYNQNTGVLKVIDKRRTTLEYTLESETVKAVNKWIEKRKEFMEGYTCDALFISNRRKRMTSKAVRDLVRNYTSGLEKHITPHKFRSSYITNIYNETGDIYLAQRSAKQKRVSTTERYIDTKVDASAEAANLVSKLLA